DRAAFRLRAYSHLKLARRYPIAVGQVGLQTPAGLYHIQDKMVDPSWQVPFSSWTGSLAGELIPPGPDDPLKARWLGIFNGAGIHGTDETWSIGHSVSQPEGSESSASCAYLSNRSTGSSGSPSL